MRVGLASITPDAERLILHCARVSSDQSNESVGLIKYLIRNKHWSPFEMAHAVFEIETSRAIAAQILRHRSFAFQEFSQRYASPDSYEKYHARRQAEKNRQSSIDDLDESDTKWFTYTQEKNWASTMSDYEEGLERGIARESLRFLLPLGTTTRLYMAGSIRSWIHYIELRTDEHTQAEHAGIARIIRTVLSFHLPNIADALGWNVEPLLNGM